MKINEDQASFIVKVMWDGEVFEPEPALQRRKIFDRAVHMVKARMVEDSDNKFNYAMFLCRRQWLMDYINEECE